MESQYRNIFGLFEGKLRDDENEAARIAVLDKLASKSATPSSLIYIIPAVALVIVGIIMVVVLKRKKSAQ